MPKIGIDNHEERGQNHEGMRFSGYDITGTEYVGIYSTYRVYALFVIVSLQAHLHLTLQC